MRIPVGASFFGSDNSASSQTATTNSSPEPEAYSGQTELPGAAGGEDFFEEIGKIVVNKLPETPDEDNQNDVFSSLEYGVVLAALKRTGGNKQAAANLLGLYRPRLYGMIKRHNLDDKI